MGDLSRHARAEGWLLAGLGTLAVAGLIGCSEDGDDSGRGDGGAGAGGATGCSAEQIAIDGQCVSVGPAAPSCPPGHWAAPNEECEEAGLPSDMPCPPGTHDWNGQCEPAGVPASACGDGFVHDGVGCEARLPSGPCGSGEIAVPGDAQCRPVASCGTGTWGDIPVDAGTVYVDASYVGNDSDGSVDRPWTTIQDAVTVAPEGSVVAIAAGTYIGQVALNGKALKLWGRCPSMVTVQGDTEFPALVVLDADDSELHQLAVTALVNGVSIHGSTGVLVDSLWVHDTGKHAFYVGGSYGIAELTIRDTLIERAAQRAIRIEGSEVLVERSAIRDTQEMDSAGAAVWVVNWEGDEARVTLRELLMTQNRQAAVVLYNAETLVEDCQIQDTLVAADGRAIGIAVQPEDATRPNLTVRRSVVRDSAYAGVIVSSTNATIEDTTIRDTEPSGEAPGIGLNVIPWPNSEHRTELSLVRSVVERNPSTDMFVGVADVLVEASSLGSGIPNELGHAIPLQIAQGPGEQPQASVEVRSSVLHDGAMFGVYVAGAKLHMDATVVRDTDNDTEFAGGGVYATTGTYDGSPADVTVERSLVERNEPENIASWSSRLQVRRSIVRDGVADATGGWGTGVLGKGVGTPVLPANLILEGVLIERASTMGVYAADSNVILDGCIVRDTVAPGDGEIGRGIHVQVDEAAELEMTLVRNTLVERAVGIGVASGGTPISIEGSMIQGTVATRTGQLGDAILLSAVRGDSGIASVIDTIASDSARAGIASFGVNVSMARNLLLCNAIDIDGEVWDERSFGFSDDGGNACGCPGAERTCKQVSSALTPPEPLEPPGLTIDLTP